jgi:23S rRNA (guanosine2251-2'-O)-methyltransferase
MKELGVILNNIRSCHNVGSILRTAEFFGFKKVWFVGVTPYPILRNDQRLPHISDKLDLQITKVSLGAENNLEMEHCEDLGSLVEKLKDEGWYIIALEQDENSTTSNSFNTKKDKVATVLGTEVTGLDKSDLDIMDEIIEIPRTGTKESLNVSVAFGVMAASLSPKRN